MRIPNAQYAIALPTGEWAYLLPGDCLMTHVGQVPRPTAHGVTFDVLYLDITTAPVFRIAGQAQTGDDGGAPYRGTWEWTSTTKQWAHISTEAPGTYPVMYDSTGTLHIATWDHNGSQGWRYESETGELVTGDHTLNAQRSVGVSLGLSGLWEYSHFAGVTIGQGETGCDVLIDGTRRRLEDGDTHFIRVRYDGISRMWAISMTKLAQGEAVIHWMLRPQLSMLPPVQVAPEPPKPQPEPEPVPMPDTTFPHGALLQQFAARFPLPQTPGGGEAHENKCRAWCLKLAEQVRFSTGDDSWGVKRAAGPQSKDTIARDLGNGKMVVFDLMTGAGTGFPTLNAQPHGEVVGEGQTFIPVSPVNHLGAVVVPPVEPGEPQPVAPGVKHPYWREDEERNECGVSLTTGGDCDQPREAAIHQGVVVDPPTKPEEPPPNATQLDRIEALLISLRAHFK